MRLVTKLALPLALAGFLVAGYGCMEQEQKAKDRGTKINATLDELQDKAKRTSNLANDKLKKMAEDLGEAVEE